MRHSSFWDAKEDAKRSWIWRKLLKLRHIAYPFFRVQTGNRQNTLFWFDDWLKMDKLIDITGHTLSQCGIGNARVCEAVSLDQWLVRGHRSRLFQDLHAKIQAVPVPTIQHSDDVILWRHSPDNYNKHFSTTWDQVRSKREEVPWSSSI